MPPPLKRKRRVLPQKEVLDPGFITPATSRHLMDDLLLQPPSEQDRVILSELWGKPTDHNHHKPHVSIGKPQPKKEDRVVRSSYRDLFRRSRKEDDEDDDMIDLSSISLLPPNLQKHHIQRSKSVDNIVNIRSSQSTDMQEIPDQDFVNNLPDVIGDDLMEANDTIDKKAFCLNNQVEESIDKSMEANQPNKDGIVVKDLTKGSQAVEEKEAIETTKKQKEVIEKEQAQSNEQEQSNAETIETAKEHKKIIEDSVKMTTEQLYEKALKKVKELRVVIEREGLIQIANEQQKTIENKEAMQKVTKELLQKIAKDTTQALKETESIQAKEDKIIKDQETVVIDNTPVQEQVTTKYTIHASNIPLHDKDVAELMDIFQSPLNSNTESDEDWTPLLLEDEQEYEYEHAAQLITSSRPFTKKQRRLIKLRQRGALEWYINSSPIKHNIRFKGRKRRLQEKIEQPYIIRKRIKTSNWKVHKLKTR